MPVFTFTPAGDSAFAALRKLQTGGDWSTVVTADDASNIVDQTSTEMILRTRLNSGNWENRRGFLYFDLSSLPSRIMGMRLKKVRLTVNVAISSHPDTGGDKFRIYGLRAENSGFDPEVGDYNGFINATKSSIFTISSTGEANIDITDSRLVRFIQYKINKKADLYLMTRPLQDVTDTDPSSTNNMGWSDPKHSTAGNRPEITLFFSSERSERQGARGTGFGGLNQSAATGTGFGIF